MLLPQLKLREMSVLKVYPLNQCKLELLLVRLEFRKGFTRLFEEDEVD